jgi:hypothetical protein
MTSRPAALAGLDVLSPEDLRSAEQRQVGAGRPGRSGLATPTAAALAAYCFVTWMWVALVVSVNPAVWLVNDPVSALNVTAV